MWSKMKTASSETWSWFGGLARVIKYIFLHSFPIYPISNMKNGGWVMIHKPLEKLFSSERVIIKESGQHSHIYSVIQEQTWSWLVAWLVLQNIFFYTVFLFTQFLMWRKDDELWSTRETILIWKSNYKIIRATLAYLFRDSGADHGHVLRISGWQKSNHEGLLLEKKNKLCLHVP